MLIFNAFCMKIVTPVPGGSGLNTATHLQALIQNFSNDDGNQEEMDVTLQTSYNEADDYGRLLVTHAEKSGFQIVNCVKPSAQDKEENGSKSTGHCMVVVSQGERSFLTHLGVMASFKGKNECSKTIYMSDIPSLKNTCGHLSH
jgi:hypothetical protein